MIYQPTELPQIDKAWTLFLDRDGVINIEKEDDYVKQVSEFLFHKQVPEAIALLNQFFGRTLIVTNQRGIGRGLMTESDLADIHQHMIAELNSRQAHIDRIYYCTDTDSSSVNRKPNPGMGYLAQQEFPAIEFKKSMMVGNTLGDMQFGRNLGMLTVFIPSTKPMPPVPHPMIDFVFPGLFQLAKALQNRIIAQ